MNRVNRDEWRHVRQREDACGGDDDDDAASETEEDVPVSKLLISFTML